MRAGGIWAFQRICWNNPLPLGRPMGAGETTPALISSFAGLWLLPEHFWNLVFPSRTSLVLSETSQWSFTLLSTNIPMFWPLSMSTSPETTEGHWPCEALMLGPECNLLGSFQGVKWSHVPPNPHGTRAVWHSRGNGEPFLPLLLPWLQSGPRAPYVSQVPQESSLFGLCFHPCPSARLVPRPSAEPGSSRPLYCPFSSLFKGGLFNAHLPQTFQPIKPGQGNHRPLVTPRLQALWAQQDPHYT